MSIKKYKSAAGLYQDVCRLHQNSDAFLTRRNGKFQALSYGELNNRGINLATSLIELGIELKDHVSILADNREEWIISEFAIRYAGCVDVPRGTDVTDQDIKYILNHSDAKCVFAENTTILKRLIKLSDELPQIKNVILMEKKSDANESEESSDKFKIHNMYELIEKGKALRDKEDRRVEDRISKITKDDLFSIIYTSGTTGNPKGVCLTNGNILSQVENCHIKFFQTDRFVSILPVWHIFERCLEFIAIYTGASTYYSNIRNLKEDLAEVKPTTMASAPRLWENVYLGILKKVSSGPKVAHALFRAAYFCSHHFKKAFRFLMFRELDVDGRNPLFSLLVLVPINILKLVIFAIPYKLLDIVVLSKVRVATGGKLRMTVSGGGALPFHIDEFFNNIGIPVLEGYGMTETSPVLAARTMKNLIIGTVGPIWPETDLRLVDIHTGDIIYPPKKGVKGEIHVRGPQVMKGYYKDPVNTEKVLKNCWLNTGDLGIITYNNCLKIVGRSKETIVLLGGENIEPNPIENKLLNSPMIEQCMVTGQDQKYLTCLVVPSLEYFSKYGADYETLSKSKEVYQTIMGEMKNIISTNNGFKAFEKVVDCKILSKQFVVGDEINNTFKLKRHVVSEKYADLIKSMYN